MTDNGSPDGASTPLTLDLATKAPTLYRALCKKAEQELAAEMGESETTDAEAVAPKASTPKAKAVEVPMVQFNGDKFAYQKRLCNAVDLTHPEHRMLTNLATYSDADLTNARPGRDLLAQHMGWTGSWASKEAGKILRSLVAKGYIEQVERGGTGKASTYRLGVPAASA